MSVKQRVQGTLRLVLFLLLVLSCHRDPPPLATLETRQGRVERDRAGAVGVFAAAELGSRFFLGEGVRTGEKSQAKLALADGADLKLEERTLIRFSTRPNDKGSHNVGLALEVGEATLTSGDEELLLDTEFGDAVLRPRSRLSLKRDDDKLRFEVAIGSAIVDAANERRTLSVGQKLEVEMGVAQLEAPSAAVPSAAASATAALPSASAASPVVPEQFSTGTMQLEASTERRVISLPGGKITVEPGALATLSSSERGTSIDVSDGTVSVQGRRRSRDLHRGEAALLDRSGEIQDTRVTGLSYADLNAGPGESLVIHDPRPPAAVAFAAPASCAANDVALRIERSRTVFVGKSRVGAAFKAGRSRYELGCVDAKGGLTNVVRGTVTVLADAGTRKLPSSAPDTQVDADGRAYTVLYQNRLPRIIARWPKAPSSAGFVLNVTSSGRTRAINLSEPRYVFQGGTLAEGSHSFVFQAGSARSRPTSVDIQFDNATPTASISSPVDGSFAPGATVMVSGSALPGWTVTAGGSELAQDAQNRFAGQAQAASDGTLVIRFAHPQRGVHLYLRRAAGAR